MTNETIDQIKTYERNYKTEMLPFMELLDREYPGYVDREIYKDPEYYICRWSATVADLIKIDIPIDIKLRYAGPNYGWREMSQIIRGFEHGLSVEQVELYTDPEYSYERMGFIRRALERNLTMAQVMVFTIKHCHLQAAEIAFINGCSVEEAIIISTSPKPYKVMDELLKNKGRDKLLVEWNSDRGFPIK